MKVLRFSEEVRSPADAFDKDSRFVVEAEKISIKVVVLLPRENFPSLEALFDWEFRGECLVEDKKTVEFSEDVKSDPIQA